MIIADCQCMNPLGSHNFKWQSLPTYGTKGKVGRQSSKLNTELAALTILTGLHFSPLHVIMNIA